MSEYVTVGRIVNTHGIKGEVKLLCYSFNHKEKVFIPNMTVYIGPNYDKEVIESYRVHKDFDMITFKGINNINNVLKYKSKWLYVKKSDLDFNENEYLIEDLVNLNVLYNNEIIGKIVDFYDNNGNIVLKINGTINFLVPHNNNFIESIDLDKKTITLKNIEGLIK